MKLTLTALALPLCAIIIGFGGSASAADMMAAPMATDAMGASPMGVPSPPSPCSWLPPG